MVKETQIMQQEILKYILDHKVSFSGDIEKQDKLFNRVALDLFDYQFHNNLPFKRYAQSQRKTPLVIKKWQDIPLMPIQGYKQLTLATTKIYDGEAVFLSSGTTDPTHRSHNYHPNFDIWDASMKFPFKQYVLPDRDEITILGLFPDETINPNSSLSRYVSKAIQFFGDTNSQTFVNKTGIEFYKVIKSLKQAEKEQRPVMLLGASFSYVHLLDFFKKHELQFNLPAGSRLFDTGGFKGLSRTITEQKLFQSIKNAFNIDRNQYINMYGMTEISSQCYDETLYDVYHRQQISYYKKFPAWVRVRILNPNTLQPVPDGQKGIVAYYDLANWHSCLAILTEDLGIKHGESFELLGRIGGAESKGCSIAIDQLLSVNQ